MPEFVRHDVLDVHEGHVSRGIAPYEIVIQ
jgi:hypothetical protein